jgi:hypothetical protein
LGQILASVRKNITSLIMRRRKPLCTVEKQIKPVYPTIDPWSLMQTHPFCLLSNLDKVDPMKNGLPLVYLEIHLGFP